MTLEGRKAKIVLILLGLSLAVNLFALSFFAGRWSVQGRPVAEQMRLTYPAEIRADVRSALEARRDEMATAVRQLRDARARMLELARVPELDQEALRGAMAEVRAASDSGTGTVAIGPRRSACRSDRGGKGCNSPARSEPDATRVRRVANGAG